MLLSGLARTAGNTEDARFNAYLLEHSWRWLVRDPLHRGLWDLPIFFPAGRNTLAFGDAMLSFAPLYWPWRAVGLAADTGYQLWLLLALALSALAAYAFLRLVVGTTRLPALLGSWLAACSASRLHQISHSQLLPQIFFLGALGALLLWARTQTAAGRWAAALVATACAVAQLYGGFYLGFFLALALVALALVALAMPDTRAALVGAVRRGWLPLLGAGAAGALALVPWYLHYTAAEAVVGRRRHWPEVASMVPRPSSWLFVSPSALLYRWTAHAPWFRDLPWTFEHAVGLGFLTTAVALVAAVLAHRRAPVRLAAGAMLLLMTVTTMVAGHTLWHRLTTLVPPLHAARAIVRVGLLLPLAAAVVLAAWADGARTARARRLALALLLLCAAEQLAAPESHDKEQQRAWVQQIVGQLDHRFAAFVVTPTGRVMRPAQVQVDAMWAGTLAGMPTVNGYSGNVPPAWLRLLFAREHFPHALGRWLGAKGARPEQVQWIRLPAWYRHPRRAGEERVSGSSASPR